MYTQLAHLYDWIGVESFNDSLFEALITETKAYGIQPPGPVLDMGCGTGTLACKLAQAGWHVTGIDLSETMLAIAREKAHDAGLSDRITFLQGDMRAFTPDQTYTLVLSTYDSLNHLLTPIELEQTLTMMGQALAKGGLLVFDVNTEHNFLSFWQGKDKDETEEGQLLFDATYDQDRGRASVTITASQYNEDGALIQQSDTVVEQFWSPQVIETALQSCGLTLKEARPFNPTPLLDGPAGTDDLVLKTLYICQK